MIPSLGCAMKESKEASNLKMHAEFLRKTVVFASMHATKNLHSTSDFTASKSFCSFL